MNKRLLSDSVREDGEAEYCKWVAEEDWAYRCTFAKPGMDGTTYLHFKGLDTVSDIYLNGHWIAGSKTMYLPVRVEVTGRLQAENDLLVYFHSPFKMVEIYRDTMPDDWKGVISPRSLLRKSGGDFGEYLGAIPGFTPIGIFGDVCLEMPDLTEIHTFDSDSTFNFDYSAATVTLYTAGQRWNEKTEVQFELCEENGTAVFSKKVPAEQENTRGWHAGVTFVLQEPKLWWPKNYGDQPLYRVTASVYVEGVLRDVTVRLTGFREVKLLGSLKFMVNGKLVKLWGANVGPIGGLSHRWDPEEALRLIRLADDCNMNALRLWGPSKIYGEELYLEADRRGFILWQDFFTGMSQFPDNQEYREIFMGEAEFLVRRLKHHPSIMIWCGGNDNIYMTEYSEETERRGHDILTHSFRELCLGLDPHRYYHDTCPTGGQYTNDPMFGDTHGNRAYLAYIPGEQNAVFFSEDIRTSPPELKSLKRFIKGNDLWPKGYTDITSFGVVKPMPATWVRRTMNFSERKFGPIEQFYDATDAESLIYKFAAAAGLSYYQTITNCRQGKPFYESAGARNCNGYLLWKLNNTWPAFYCGIIDNYLETHIPYFAVKRAFAPFLLTIDVRDHIYIWGGNDTTQDVCGQLTVKLYRLWKNKVVKELSICAAIPAGESMIIANLDSLGAVWKDTVVFASLSDSEGNEAGRAIGFVDMERHLQFPEARLSLFMEDGGIVVSTDSFARCVELSGDENGDAFGWRFEDNFFDLLPFEGRRVAISGRHGTGMISAKAHYSNHVTKIAYTRKTQ
ncbi:MAG TPA: glycoside hydrolase family 2 protein [Clostridia bacterium]